MAAVREDKSLITLDCESTWVQEILVSCILSHSLYDSGTFGLCRTKSKEGETQ